MASLSDDAHNSDVASKLVLKGILHPADADRAALSGVDAVVVSSHGGRQLDSAPAPIEMRGPVVDAVAGRAAVILDGGIRTGEDIARALALRRRAGARRTTVALGRRLPRPHPVIERPFYV